MKIRTFLSILIACALVGCATKKVEVTQSGFLTNYEQLKPKDEDKKLLIYHNPAVDFRKDYTKIIIEPVEFYLEAEANEDFDQEDRDKLSLYFEEKLDEKLSELYEITHEPGEDTLLLRSAVTHLLPNKVYLNLHWSTTLAGAGIGGASIEVELIDSLTNERILAFVDARKGKKYKYAKGLTKWGHTKTVLKKWAKILVENLEELSQ